MLKQVRKVLVESFVGAIALGWIFAQGILHFAFIVVAPLAGWMSRRQYSGLLGQNRVATGFSFEEAIPEMARSFSLLLVGYLLLRWLYFKPLEEEQPRALNTESDGTIEQNG